MKSILLKVCLGSLLLILSLTPVITAQTPTTITGTVTDKTTGNGLQGVTVAVKGAASGTITGGGGTFQLKTTHSFPLTLVFSYVGFRSEERKISSPSDAVTVQLSSTEILGQEVVVAASRVQESILESPVSIEKLDARALKASPAPSFYDALANLKGVEMSTQSLTFKSVNTRGFNSNGNTRVLQLNDGMDNQAPGLNFSVGNMVGIPELDLENVELIPGAASALYGPNALNGIVLMNSKNPFQYQGLSALVKTGFLNDKGRTSATTGFYDVSVRFAHAFNNKWAFKVNLGYIRADDWQAYDKRDQSLANGHTLADGTRENNEGYNGVNIYGDENTVNMYSALGQQFANQQSELYRQLAGISQQMGGAVSPTQLFNGLVPRLNVTRTGYNEADVVDYKTKNLKFNGAIHYKIRENLEALIQGSYGSGTTVYTGADRYSLKDFNMGQYKIELRSPDFYVRAYTTQERSGDSYAGGTLASGINEAWKSSQVWYGQYFGKYVADALPVFAREVGRALQTGSTPNDAIASGTRLIASNYPTYFGSARAVADNGRLIPGTQQFNDAADKVKGKPIPGDATGVGAKFTDKTNLYQLEFMYNFHNLINFAEILVGGNYRRYALNSEKTLFAVDDNGKEFRINEYGGYVQIMKKLAQDHLKLTGSLRYDKNMNFKGQFSPRLSAVYTFLETHNIRASFQTGFRIPHNQDQYIDLVTPQAHLIGGLPFLRTRYGLDTGRVFTLQSVQAGAPKQYTFREFKPERIEAYEIGYKALIAKRLLIDAYIYKNDFKNMNGIQILLKPVGATNQVFSLPVSAEETVKSWGWAIGLDYSLPLNFTAGGNISYNELSNAKDLGTFIAMYNTPKVRYSLNVGNRNIAKSNIAVNVIWKWQDAFVWQSSFVGPNINTAGLSEIPAYGTLDAMVSKLFPKIKTTVKLGGVNILNKGYIQSWGNPTVGAQWYVSLGYNL
ncbi:TonB-dependent receptor [Chitinophaga solisilvae]|uniref:TonB-dependent receptor n=1 Tax=Chitinophaga solisilvae TaxID=1233460 RepID=A0A433WIP7_9BACT|nr:TonB-dependent receptor [Chitinophaga solisilvae]NSL86674.1 TonB-dependent receptor [Chitinophaga solisilvae]